MKNHFEDDHVMTFGKHKGELLGDVPVNYLHWLWQQGKKFERNDPLANYIRVSLPALQQEDPDLLWD